MRTTVILHMAFDSKPPPILSPAGHGYAFEVKKGDYFLIVDVHGHHVVDFAAWLLPEMKGKISMAYTPHASCWSDSYDRRMPLDQ